MRQSIFIVAMTVAVALLLPTTAHTDSREWGYRGEKGKDPPVNWPGLCQEDGEQSPINITRAASSGGAAEPIIFHYKPAESQVKDNDKAVEVVKVVGAVEVAGTTYQLCDFHFHTPSEHTVENVGTAAEVHFVHQTRCDDENSNVLVIGALIAPASPGPPNATLSKYLKDLGYLPAKTPELNPGDILPTEGYYQYSGSLTTPDCSTGVIWFVAQEPLYLANQDLIRLRAYYPNNARPGQSLGSRKLRGTR